MNALPEVRAGPGLTPGEPPDASESDSVAGAGVRFGAEAEAGTRVEAGPELILDTTYLLPIFGVGVGLPRYESLFTRLLETLSVGYNPVSLVEAKWISLGLARDHPDKRDGLLSAYRRGLAAILLDERISATELTGPEVEAVADRLLLEFGLADYFDRVIYATAVVRNATLLTEDGELLRLARSPEAPRPREAMRWADVPGRLLGD
ncbi:MAG: hypothetical protein QI223_00395 [Candidatus Korarchaeota archaeon]|nr:hypothetical protein [Candidatus Korarchaeota archaeon]